MGKAINIVVLLSCLFSARLHVRPSDPRPDRPLRRGGGLLLDGELSTGEVRGN